MGRVSQKQIDKLNAFLDSLPDEARSKCTLCNETLTHIVKQAEAKTGAGTETVTNAIAKRHNESAAPQDKVSGKALSERVRQKEGKKQSILSKRENTKTITRGVVIDSGPISAEDTFDEIPKDKWHFLISARASFLDTRLGYDCRCLVRFVKEAEKMWHELGYANLEHMLREGYRIDPYEVDIAIEWLGYRDPDFKFSLEDWPPSKVAPFDEKVYAKELVFSVSETIDSWPVKHRRAAAGWVLYTVYKICGIDIRQDEMPSQEEYSKKCLNY